MSADSINNVCVVMCVYVCVCVCVCQGATGMNEKVFNEKMRMLQQQRQAQVQVSRAIVCQ